MLCSSAVRTRQTLDAILPALEGEPEVLVEDGLYGALADNLLARLRAVPADVPSVLLIGHNPGSGTSRRARGRRRRRGAAAAREGYRRRARDAAIADGGWAELDDGGAELTDYVVPRELA